MVRRMNKDTNTMSMNCWVINLQGDYYVSTYNYHRTSVRICDTRFMNSKNLTWDLPVFDDHWTVGYLYPEDSYFGHYPQKQQMALYSICLPDKRGECI